MNINELFNDYCSRVNEALENGECDEFQTLIEEGIKWVGKDQWLTTTQRLTLWSVIAHLESL